MVERFQLICSYLGGEYYGWQRQPDVPTVQGVIEDQIGRLTENNITIHASGRTDRGVNALGQVTHFDTGAEVRIRSHNWTAILNNMLPCDIRIRSVKPVDEKFHARHSARLRVYGYRFLCLDNKKLKPELEWRFAPQEWFPSAAGQAVGQLRGGVKTKQFSGRGGSTYEAEYWPLELELRQISDREIWLLVAAKSFRYKMVRCIASAVGQCLSGTLSAGDLKTKLHKSEQTIKPAPAAGCYLLNVNYKEKDNDLIIDKAWQRVKYFVDAGSC